MKLARDLTHSQLAIIVEQIRSVLWWERCVTKPGAMHGHECTPGWSLDKEWDTDTTEAIATLLSDAGLKPESTS